MAVTRPDHGGDGAAAPGRIIMHVDMDAFFVAVERREDSSLVGRKVVIGADPQEGRGRGVVMAASYEARASGVHSAMPISRAYRLCPDAVYLPPRPALYMTASREVMDLLKKYADRFEQVSVDEAYLDTTSAGDFENALRVATNLQGDVRGTAGLSCSVGVAPNKSIAKMASEAAKPGGIRVVRPEEVTAFLDPLPVSKISGVGKKTGEVLEALGIRTIGDLARFPGPSLTKVLGRNAVWLWGIARGIEAMPVEEREEQKSLSVEHTFEQDTDDWQAVEATVDVLVEELLRRAQSGGITARTIGIKVRTEGFQTYTRDRTMEVHSLRAALIRSVALDLLREFQGRRLRLLGLRLSNLQVARGDQQTLPGLGA